MCSLNIQALKQETDQLFPQIVQWRRHLHRHPELSFQETATTAYIEAQLKDLPGVELPRPTKTGLVVRIKGGHPGRRVAFRADIDALPVTEKSGEPTPRASCTPAGTTGTRPCRWPW